MIGAKDDHPDRATSRGAPVVLRGRPHAVAIDATSPFEELRARAVTG